MAALVGRIVGAKPFPESARKLAELTRKDVLRIEPIIQVLERDPGLSARLLRLVNSAGYALRQRCTSVRHAATLVGTDRLHQIATTAAVLDLFDARGSVAAKIVEHSTIVGAFCRYFGAHLALPVDDLFTAGFLHDIGKLMLLETEGDQYFSLLEKYADRPDSIHVVERSLFGFDHAVLAAHVLTQWNIPDPVPKIVAWHHDPTRAYRVSSVMAALVQTVRLADLAVYAMVNGAGQAQFATLASTESASYLDISEPQLSSMWDELQTLYSESIEQCRGENAPALDPRSLRPKQPINLSTSPDVPRSAELPLQFPCVVCGKPSFGNTCRACGGHMCPEHQEGREDWCSICARDYYREASELTSIVSPRLAAAIGLATVLISGSIGYQTSGVRGGVRATVGTVLLLILVTVLTIVGRRLLLRFRFIRTRPNRTIAEPQESDGGLHSLVPPASENPPRLIITSQRDPLTEQLRLSGAVIDQVMIREVPSSSSIAAPKPFEGLTEGHPPSSGRMASTLPKPTPTFVGSATSSTAFTTTTEGTLREATSATPTISTSPLTKVAPLPIAISTALDDERLAMQGRSLVTLPAPASTLQGTETVPIAPSPIRSVEEKDVESDDRTSEFGIDVLGATPPSEPPLEVLTQTSPDRPSDETSRAVAAKRRSSGTYPSHPPSAVAEPEIPESPVAAFNQHPLAALGITSEVPSARLTQEQSQEASAPKESPEDKLPSAERHTLRGLSADEIQRALASPPVPLKDLNLQTPTAPKPNVPPLSPETPTIPKQPPQPLLSPNAEREINLRQDSPPHYEAKTSNGSQSSPTSSTTPPASRTVVSTPATASTQSSDTGLPLAELTPLERQLLAKMGPEFQSKVMSLVADRVATVIADRMLESLGHEPQKSRSSNTSGAAKSRKNPSETDSSANSTKPRRRKSPLGRAT
jgi:HD-like signal output (HDOD) protein